MKKNRLNMVDSLAMSGVLLGTVISIANGADAVFSAKVSVGITVAYAVVRVVSATLSSRKMMKAKMAEMEALNARLARIEDKKERNRSFKNFDLKKIMEESKDGKIQN